MHLPACILLLLVSTTQAVLQTTRLHRPKSQTLLTPYSHRKTSQYAIDVEDPPNSYQEREIRKEWDSLQRYLGRIFSGKVWMAPEKNHQGKTVKHVDPGLRPNPRDPHIWPIKFFDEHIRGIKTFKYVSSNMRKPKEKTDLRKSASQPHPRLNKETVLPRPKAKFQPFVPIYFPPPPPGNPGQLPPPPFALPPSPPQVDVGRTREQIQPRSTDGVFNRPTTHLLHTHPTWPSDAYGDRDASFTADGNTLMYGNTPTSLTDFQNIPTRPSSNIYSDQATGFPANFWEPPPEVVVIIQSPETSLDWSLPAPPHFTCDELLGDLVSLRSSGMPIRLELGADTSESKETCVYLKQMFAQDPGEQLEWTIAITDDVGQALWESKCLPGSTFNILPGYHVEFKGMPAANEYQPPQEAPDYEAAITQESILNLETLHDKSKLVNVVPLPGHSRKQNWTSNADNASPAYNNFESTVHTAENGR